MTEEKKVDWRVRVDNIAKEIEREASNLNGFLSKFFNSEAAQLPEVRPVALLVEVVIEKLKEIVNIAMTIQQELSKKEVDWGKIKEVFPTREWLASIEASLYHLDFFNRKFRGIMPFYSGRLREDFTEKIEAKLQQMLDIFVRELGLEEIGEKYMEKLKSEPPTEEELEREHREAKKTPQPEDLPSLFNEISRVLMEELKGNEKFFELWNKISEQFENALKARNKYELWDVHRQILAIFEGMSEEKREKYKEIFDRFTRAVRTTYPLRKFKLIRYLLGLEG